MSSAGKCNSYGVEYLEEMDGMNCCVPIIKYGAGSSSPSSSHQCLPCWANGRRWLGILLNGGRGFRHFAESDGVYKLPMGDPKRPHCHPGVSWKMDPCSRGTPSCSKLKGFQLVLMTGRPTNAAMQCNNHWQMHLVAACQSAKSRSSGG